MLGQPVCQALGATLGRNKAASEDCLCAKPKVVDRVLPQFMGAAHRQIVQVAQVAVVGATVACWSVHGNSFSGWCGLDFICTTDCWKRQ
jgi:hypothetical protein